MNILLLGIDRRPDEGDAPARTDTMMIVTFDPYGHTAGLLSIPRDLWVPIPLKDGSVIQDRVNTANTYGELYHYPGGGPALAKSAVEYNLGVRIHYYTIVDFAAFQRIVDTLGGITVHLSEPLIDNAYPTDDYETMRISIPAGVQHLDGQRALWYARSRHGSSDISRMKRQQEVLLALREKALSLTIIPKLPQLWREFRGGVQTDMSLAEVLALAQVGKDTPRENITSRSIDGEYVIPGTTWGGADVLLPNREAIRGLVREVFYDARLRGEAAKVEVLNGAGRAGLATRTADFLRDKDINVVSFGNAPDGRDLAKTEIILFTNSKYTAGLLTELFQLPQDRVRSSSENAGPVDIRIILGRDAPEPPS